jgi:hypothetical protein
MWHARECCQISSSWCCQYFSLDASITNAFLCMQTGPNSAKGRHSTDPLLDRDLYAQVLIPATQEIASSSQR